MTVLIDRDSRSEDVAVVWQKPVSMVRSAAEGVLGEGYLKSKGRPQIM